MHHLTITSFSSRVSTLVCKCLLAVGIAFLISACGEKSAEDHYQDAGEFSANGNKEAAVVALKNAVQEAPDMAKARYALGKLYLELRSFDSAGKELVRALDSGHPENEVIPLLAEALQRSGANVALSELSYQADLLTPEEQVEVGYRKTHALIALNKEAESTAQIKTLDNIDVNTPYKIMVASFALAIGNQFPEALVKVKEALAMEPLNRDAINLTARMYLLNGDPQNAAKLYEDYIKVAPDDIEAKFALTNMLIQQEETARAEPYIDEMLSGNPNNPTLNQLKAVVRAAASDYEKAFTFAEKSISGGNPDPSARLIAGLAAYQLEDHANAIKHLSVIATVLPDNHPALRMLAASQLQLNMGNDAGEILSRVGNVSQDDIALFSRASFELIKSGNTEAAKQMLEQTERFTESADDLTKLGVLKLSLDDLEGIVDLEGAVAKAPESARAKSTLAGAYLGTNQLAKALELAKSWQIDEPNDVDGFLLESEVLQRQEKYDQAAQLINAAMKVDAQNRSVALAAIRLDLRQNKLNDAQVKTEAFLEIYPSDVTALASYFQIKISQNDPQPAVLKILAAANKNTNEQPLVLLAARALQLDNKLSEALDMLKNIEESRLTPSTYWDVKGAALIGLNRSGEAYAHYAKWANFFPDLDAPTIGLLRVLDVQRDFPKGAAVAADFLAKNDNVQIKLMRAYFLAMSRDAKQAKQIINSVAPEYQALAFVRGIKARIALLEGRGAQAVEDAKVSYEDNRSAENLLVYVQTLDRAGKSDEAFAVIQEQVKNAPNDARSRALLAERQIMSDPKGALATYEEMLKNFPSNPVLLNNAGYLHMQANNLEKAFEYSNKAFGISPKNVAFGDTFAQVLIRRGEVGKAVDAYNSVITPAVTDETILLNYIEALMMNKDNSAARRKIQEFNSTLKSKDARARLLILQSTYMN